MDKRPHSAVAIPRDTYDQWVEELRGERLVDTVFDFASGRINYQEPFDGNRELLKFAEGIRQVYRSWRFESEVTNGGFLQFIDNNGLNFAKATVDDLDSVGLPERKSLLAAAIDVFAREEGKSDPNAPAWWERDKRFYHIQKEIEAAKVLDRYIRSHADRFVRP